VEDHAGIRRNPPAHPASSATSTRSNSGPRRTTLACWRLSPSRTLAKWHHRSDDKERSKGTSKNSLSRGPV
jgi:hypothetical protein